MAQDRKTVRRIYNRTDGKCHICHKKLSLKNYGKADAKGGWEVEHSIALANGGTDHLNNLYPACITCNRAKGTLATRTARSWSGHTKAPISKERKAQIRKKNTVGWAALGGLIGLAINPAAALWGAGIGALIGHSTNPEG